MSKSLSPAVAAAVEFVRSQIRSGNYSSGSYLPAETELAAIVGLSRGTVREAIDFLSATGEITKRAHSRPVIGLVRESRPVQSGRDVHVWVSHPIEDDASLVFVKGISKGFRGTQYRMIVREPTRFFADFVADDERSFLENLVRDEEAAGAIIQRDPWANNSDVVKAVLDAGKPLVFVDCPPPSNLPADHVGTANRSAARRTIEHLIDLGHTNIACLADSEIANPVLDRVQGYRQAMSQAGLASHIKVLVADRIDNSVLFPVQVAGRFAARLKKQSTFPELSHRLVCSILNLPERPTALFVSCDVVAYWVIAMLEGSGVRVPQDIAVAGFDYLSRWEGNEFDLLTTSKQDFEGFGRFAADLLLDRLEGDHASPPKRILLEAPLVIRSTTASDHPLWVTHSPGNSAENLP